MPLDLLPALAAFAFVTSATPGPNNLMLMASGTNFGFLRSLPHMLGVTLGFMLMIALVGLGPGAVIKAFPALEMALTLTGALYLLYLAWKIATAAPPKASAEKANARPMSFTGAALFQWVNPKAWTMALTAVTAYLPDGPTVAGIALVVLVFGLINLPVVTAWTALGVQLRQFLMDPARLRAFNLVAALLLVASLYPALAALPF